MNIFVEALIFVLAGYLSFTNTLAEFIQSYLPIEQVYTEEAPADSEIIHLYSFFDTSLPDILLNSAAYQQAALSAAAGQIGATTDDPTEALVNIFCTFETSEYIRTTTGTGFFIDPDGVILTNAHIAQFLLLENTESFGDTECIVRGGNPASPQYYAGLLYISPAWVESNAAMVNAAVPMGTGERDYALLYVKSSYEGDPLPASFPALSFDAELLPLSLKGDDVTAAGYPATALLKNGPDTDLFSQVATTSVSELYIFGSN